MGTTSQFKEKSFVILDSIRGVKKYRKKLKRDIIVILVEKNASILRSMYFLV